MAACTRCRVTALISPWLLTTRETVLVETSAMRATSCRVTWREICREWLVMWRVMLAGAYDSADNTLLRSRSFVKQSMFCLFDSAPARAIMASPYKNPKEIHDGQRHLRSCHQEVQRYHGNQRPQYRHRR